MSIKHTETKATLEATTLGKLRQLVQVNRDSATGFQEAADAINDNSLATDFRVWAADRTRQADELTALMASNDEDAPEDESWTAAFHQAWLKFRAGLSDGDAYVVLAEAERGEDVIKEKYEEVLKETPGSAVNDLLQRQYADVVTVHDRVRDLRDARKRKK